MKSPEDFLPLIHNCFQVLEDAHFSVLRHTTSVAFPVGYKAGEDLMFLKTGKDPKDGRTHLLALQGDAIRTAPLCPNESINLSWMECV